MLLRCIHIVGLVYCILFAVAFQGVAYNSWTIVLTFFAVCIFIGISTTRCFARFTKFNNNQKFDCAVLGTYFWWVVLNYFLELREIEILVAKRNVNWTLSSQLDIVWNHIWKFHCSSTVVLHALFFFFGDCYISLMVFSSVYTSYETLRFVAILSCSFFSFTVRMKSVNRNKQFVFKIGCQNDCHFQPFC